jgi:GDP-4-dehydro-6-deoxy-D-mannose reductase
MRVLITGITGFAGSHLADYLLAEQPGVEVFGTKRWRSPTENIDHLGDRVQLVECDLKDGSSVRRILADIRPERIFHLAAQSYVPTSWSAPSETLSNNILSQTNIFEAMRSLDLEARIQIAGSSEEYGLVHPGEVPIKETNPLRPLSPYAVSKVTQDLLAYQYFRSYGLQAVRTRGFNHTGPRRGEVFVTSNFAKQIAAIEAGLRTPILRVGNLSAQRDFTDVRDTVRAYWLALEKGQVGEVYNLASGRAVTIQQLLDMLLGLSEVEVEVQVDPERLRPSDVEILIGDASKFRTATGWEPLIPLEQTVEDLLNYWRQRLSRPRPASAT